jgi:zinc transport system permease protein
LNFLFGNILWINSRDLLWLAGLDAGLLITVALLYRKFLALCFDEEQASLQGVAVKRLYLLLLCLIAVSIVLLLQVIGTILVIAMLIIPATLAGLFTRRLHLMMGTAVLLSALFSGVGLGAAHSLNWPPGATIALVAAAAYLLSLPLKKIKFSLNRVWN